jgi:septum site-determining protein MinD
VQAAIKDRRIENLYLIPASQSDNKDDITPEQMKEMCAELKKEFDIILMDCPAGIERGFENAVAGADEAVVICTPEISSIRDADRIIGLLFAKQITPKLIVNRIIPEMVDNGDMLSHEDVVDVLSIELIGLVEMDTQVVVSTNTGMPLPLNKSSNAGRAFSRIAMRLNGKSDLPIEVPSSNRGIFKKLGRKIGFGR